MEWREEHEDYDYKQEIARAAYADMLHDTERNKMYDSALQVAIAEMRKRGKPAVVLDIGTGTGLLSMMAARAGADVITACEAFTPMADCARQVMTDNKYKGRIHLVPKRSTELVVGPDGDMKQRANILVTEVFDTELIGEGAIPTFTHAHEHLLEKDCIVVPTKSTMYAQIVHSDKLQTWNRVEPITVPGTCHHLYPPTAIGECCGTTSLHDLQLDQLDQDMFQKITEPTPVFSFDFSGSSPLCKTRCAQSRSSALSSGRCDAVLMWWDLQMDIHNDIILSCAPRWAHPTPHDMQWRDHWMQAIYYPQHKVEVNKGDEIVLHSCHDEYSLWFDVVKQNGNGHCHNPQPPNCTGGAHRAFSRNRLGAIQDEQKNRKLCAALRKAVTEKTVCLGVGDGSLLSLMAAKMDAKHCYTIESEGMFATLVSAYISQNRLNDKITVINKHVDDVTTDDLDGRKIDVLISDTYHSTSSLPWHCVQFWYQRTHLAPYLSPNVTISPRSATLYAVAVEFKDLWKIRAPVGNCEGFDLSSFDKLILEACNEVDDPEEPQPLWEYPSKALTKPVPLIRLDFTQPLSGLKNVNRQGMINFSSKGSCNGVALWSELHIDSETTLSTGPTETIHPGSYIHWDMDSKQGVHLLPSPVTVVPGVGLNAQQFRYAVTFTPSNGDFKFRFKAG